MPLPGTLTAGKAYGWRVDTIVSGRTYVGIPRSFKTRGPLVVTTLIDENDPGIHQGVGDSLREALNTAIPGELINFASNLSGGTIALAGTPLTLTKNVTVDASTLPDRITINAGGASRAITVSTGSSVVLKGLMIAGGRFQPGGRNLQRRRHTYAHALHGVAKRILEQGGRCL